MTNPTAAPDQPGQIVPRTPPPARTGTLIVGAGVAGLYCAWRLLRDKPDEGPVVILDALGRTGGRLQTDRIFLADGVELKDEEGGMRFNSTMTELLNLAAALGIPDSEIVGFGMGGDANRFHVRGRSFTVAESTANDNAIWSELYALQPAERAIVSPSNGSAGGPKALIDAVFGAICAENGVATPPETLTPQWWSRFRNDWTYQGTPLNEWGMWSLLRSFVLPDGSIGYSQECITMLGDVVGFMGPFEADVNAGDAFQILEDFPSKMEFKAFAQGFSTLPDALTLQLVELGATLCTGVRAVRVTPAQDDFEVEWETSDAWDGEGADGGTINASTVILAVPAAALGALTDQSEMLADSESIDNALGACVGMPLLKINLYYAQAWWHSKLTPPITDGPSFTDLPLNAAYVFDPVGGQSADGPAPLTIYCDFAKVNFWEELQSIGAEFTSALQEKYNDQVPQVLFGASQAIVDEATRQLAAIFGMDDIPEPILTSFRSWNGEDDFGDAYHQWARFVNDAEVIEEIAQPIEGEGLFICNEAFSDMQGWVNGSLRSADNVLERFGLEPLPGAAG